MLLKSEHVTIVCDRVIAIEQSHYVERAEKKWSWTKFKHVEVTSEKNKFVLSVECVTKVNNEDNRTIRRYTWDSSVPCEQAYKDFSAQIQAQTPSARDVAEAALINAVKETQ